MLKLKNVWNRSHKIQPLGQYGYYNVDILLIKNKVFTVCAVIRMHASSQRGSILVVFIHYVGMCRTQQFLAVLRSFFHSSLLCTFSCHPSLPTILPSSLTSYCHLFLGQPLSLVPKFIYNTLLGIIFSSILCTCPNQRNLFNLIVSIIVGFFNTCINFFKSLSHTIKNFVNQKLFESN